MAKNKKHHPMAVNSLKALTSEVVPIKRQLHKLSHRYRTLATAADRKACEYKNKLEMTGHSVNGMSTNDESDWLLRFHNAYAYASEVYSDISKALSVTINGGSVHFGKLPTHPSQIDATAKIEDLKTAYAQHRIYLQTARAHQRSQR